MPFDTSMYRDYAESSRRSLSDLVSGIQNGLGAYSQAQRQKTQDEMQQQQAQRQQAAFESEQLDLDRKRKAGLFQNVGETAGNLMSIQDPQAAQTEWGNVRANLINSGMAKPQELPENFQMARPMVDFYQKKHQQTQQKDALENQYKQAQIAELQAKARRGGGDPIAQMLAVERLEKLQREAQEAAFKKSPEGRLQGMGSSDRVRFDNVVGATRAITGMEHALKNGDFTFSIVGDNDFTRNARVWEEMVGRMQSGGAITADEGDRFRKLVPTKWDSVEQQEKKLAEMRSIMEERFGTMGFKKDDATALGLDPSALGWQAAQQTKIISGKTYRKVPGGWQEVE